MLGLKLNHVSKRGYRLLPGKLLVKESGHLAAWGQWPALRTQLHENFRQLPWPHLLIIWVANFLLSWYICTSLFHWVVYMIDIRDWGQFFCFFRFTLIYQSHKEWRIYQIPTNSWYITAKLLMYALAIKIVVLSMTGLWDLLYDVQSFSIPHYDYSFSGQTKLSAVITRSHIVRYWINNCR